VWNDFHPANEQIAWIPPAAWEAKMRVSANLPIQLVYPIRAMYLNAFARARKRIWLTTPYFIPDRQLLRSLMDAAERGVDVRVMVPQESNHILGDWLSRGFFEQMINSDVTVLLYTASMIHSKVATVDGEWSTVGTANIDRLSLSFNYETNVEVIDEDFAAEMEKVFDSDSADCIGLGAEGLDRHRLTKLAERALVPMRPWLCSPDDACFETVLQAHSTFVAGMAGGQICDLGGPQRCEASCGFGGEHARCRAHVVTAVVEHGDAFDGDPVRQIRDQGHTDLGDGDVEACELVRLGTGAGAEVTGQVTVGSSQEVHGEVLGPQRDPVGVVGLRQPEAVPLRTDARLRVEPDQAPGPFAFGRGGDDDERCVGRLQESIEVGAHDRPSSVGPAS